MARKTKEDSQKTREALLDAAEHLFLEKGVGRTTLADIASAANVTRGAIYWHFSSKEALFSALCQRAKALLPPRSTPDALAVDDPIDALLDFCTENMARCLNNDSLINLFKILHQQFEIDENCRKLFIEFNNHLTHTIGETAQYFRIAVKQGKLPPDFDAESAALALKAFYVGLVECFLLSPEIYALPGRARDLIEWIFKGLYPRTS